MKKILWMAGGIMIVSVVFFIPEQSGSMWSSLIMSGFAGLLYLTAFSHVWLKEIESAGKRKAIGWTLVVLVVFSMTSAATSYINSTRQSVLLPAIRTTIETNMVGLYINEPLLKTLRTYHSATDERPAQSIENLFLTRYDSLISENNVFNYGTGGEDRTLSLYLAKTGSDSIVLIGESGYIDGRDPDFKNFSGESGRYQVEGILTPEGVHYERTN